MRLPWALTLALTLLAACGRQPAPARRDLAFGPAQPAKVTPLLPGGRLPEVTLLDAGREPRRVLRYHPSAGTSQKVKIVQKTRSALLPIFAHEMVTRAEATVVEATPAGSRVSETVAVEKFGLPGAGQTVSEEQQRLMATMGDVHNSIEVDAQGRSDAERLMSGVANAITVLPAMPVGLGARWRVTSRRVQQVVGESDVVYELVSWDGDLLTLRSEAAFNAPPQRMSGPVELRAMNGKGHGEQQVDLTRLLPRSDHQEMETEMRLQMNNEGELNVSMKGEFVIREE